MKQLPEIINEAVDVLKDGKELLDGTHGQGFIFIGMHPSIVDPILNDVTIVGGGNPCCLIGMLLSCFQKNDELRGIMESALYLHKLGQPINPLTKLN